jgi:hypothetical protein
MLQAAQAFGGMGQGGGNSGPVPKFAPHRPLTAILPAPGPLTSSRPFL